MKTMAARGLVNGRGPLRRSGRGSVFKTLMPQLFYINDKVVLLTLLCEDVLAVDE